MSDYVEPEEAVGLPGLRLAITEGLPGPWGEAAKGVFHVKQIPFVKVRQRGGLPNQALKRWTGHENAPIAVYEHEPPRTTWTEILFLAERLAPERPLVPADPEERALMFGLSHELCGELGLGWCRRLMMIDSVLGTAPDPLPPALEPVGRLAARYGYSQAAARAAPARVQQILALLGRRLAAQRARGSRFYVHDRLSALDIHAAAFMGLVEPLPADVCPMPPTMRGWYVLDPALRGEAASALLAHRDFIYREHLGLPVDL